MTLILSSLYIANVTLPYGMYTIAKALTLVECCGICRDDISDSKSNSSHPGNGKMLKPTVSPTANVNS